MNPTKEFKAYLHSSKEYMWEIGEELGMDENTIRDSFAYALSEIELDCVVDMNTGIVKIVAVDGEAVR